MKANGWINDLRKSKADEIERHERYVEEVVKLTFPNPDIGGTTHVAAFGTLENFCKV